MQSRLSGKGCAGIGGATIPFSPFLFLSHLHAMPERQQHRGSSVCDTRQPPWFVVGRLYHTVTMSAVPGNAHVTDPGRESYLAQDRSTTTLVSTWTVTGIAFLVATARLYVRAIMRRNVRNDDYFIILSVVRAIGCWTLCPASGSLGLPPTVRDLAVTDIRHSTHRRLLVLLRAPSLPRPSPTVSAVM